MSCGLIDVNRKLQTTMTLTIHLSAETTRKLEELAVKSGRSIEVYVEQLLEQKVVANGGQPLNNGRGWEEVCTPITDAVSKTAMSDEEVAEFFSGVREEVRADKRGQRVIGTTN